MSVPNGCVFEGGSYDFPTDLSQFFAITPADTKIAMITYIAIIAKHIIASLFLRNLCHASPQIERAGLFAYVIFRVFLADNIDIIA